MKLILKFQKLDAVKDFIFFRYKNSPRQAALKLVNEDDLLILDVCTGTAANVINIAKGFPKHKIVAIDVSRKILAIAEKKINRFGLTNVELIKMDAANMRFQDSNFDVVMIAFVLHEIKSELANQILREVKRIVKDEGKIIVVEWEKPTKVLQKLRFQLLYIFEPPLFKAFIKNGMNRYFNDAGLENIMQLHCSYSTVIQLRK